MFNIILSLILKTSLIMLCGCIAFIAWLFIMPYRDPKGNKVRQTRSNVITGVIIETILIILFSLGEFLITILS